MQSCTDKNLILLYASLPYVSIAQRVRQYFCYSALNIGMITTKCFDCVLNAKICRVDDKFLPSSTGHCEEARRRNLYGKPFYFLLSEKDCFTKRYAFWFAMTKGCFVMLPRDD